MARYLSWFANLSLGVLACYLLAQSINTVVASFLDPSPVGYADPGVAEAASPEIARDHGVILTRNLFNASTLSPPAGAPSFEEEELEATQLPLTLLGTAAAEVPELSWAAIQDRESQQTLVLRIGDEVRNQAVVRRIERRRIVLEERGALRELALEETAEPSLAAAPRSLRTSARRSPRSRRVTPPPAAVTSGEGARSPAQLFSEARILPKYEAGQMVGVQVSSIKPGSLFEKIGIQNGETITELNGIRIDSPEQSAKILLELTNAETFTVEVEGPDGTRTVDVDLPEP